jgi:phosphoglycerol transferase MdoB-like AlkP superfamily enzyme
MSHLNSIQRLVERRWVLLTLAVTIGLVSLFLFSITVQRDFYEYLVYPKEKAADHYIYPELRYTFFDGMLMLWCLDGFVACGLFLWSLLTTRNNSKLIYRTMVIYFVLFIALILGGILMMTARNHGL